MFDYGSLEDIRSLEAFVNVDLDESILKKNPQEDFSKESLFDKVRNYFTGKNHISYSYSENPKTRDIDYFSPRTLSSDLKSAKNYISNLFRKN